MDQWAVVVVAVIPSDEPPGSNRVPPTPVPVHHVADVLRVGREVVEKDFDVEFRKDTPDGERLTRHKAEAYILMMSESPAMPGR